MNILSVTGLIIFIASIVLALYSLLNSKKMIHLIWSFFSFSVALWGFGIFEFAKTQNIEQSLFWWRVAEIGVILIPVFLTHFVYEFLGRTKVWFIFLLYSVSGVFIVLNLFTNLLIRNLRFSFDQFYYITATPLYTTLIVIFLGLAIYNICILYRAKKSASDIFRHQINYLLFSLVVGFVGGATSFLPVYEIDIYPVYNIAIVASALTVVYSMFRHKLLAIKVIATQFLIFSIWSFLLGRVLLAKDFEAMIIDSVLLVAVIIFGVLLIRSVLKEIETREKVEFLAQDLEKANARLKILDQQKSEFVSIASHQLRSPLTAITGYASMMAEGSCGVLGDKSKEAVRRIFESSKHLAKVVEDLLNVTKIEQGGMKFEFTKVDLRKMAKDLTEELTPNIEKAGLKLVLGDNGHHSYDVKADYEKLRQVMANLIDNAIKYTPKGEISVFLSEDDALGKVTLSVKDSGIGVPKELQTRLFEKFSRGSGISKINTGGSGLGLYVAKEIIDAHSGRIWVESNGEGKGSTFIMELEEYGHTEEARRASKFA